MRHERAAHPLVTLQDTSRRSFRLLVSRISHLD